MKSKLVMTILYFIGLILLFFSNGRMAVEVIAFIAPVLLLFIGRKMKPLRVYLQYSIGMGIVFLFSFWKFSSTNVKNPLLYIPFFLGFLMSIPYVADVFFHQRKKGVIADFGFPLTYVVVEFIYVSVSPFGSTGSIAYAEDGFLVLLQLLSITGIYGITFIVTWFGSSMATVLEDGFKTKKSIYALVGYGVTFVLVMVFGMIRLNTGDLGDKIQVAGISVYDQRSPETKAIWKQGKMRTDEFKRFAKENFDKIELATKKVAQEGAKIVVWAELSPWSWEEQIDDALQRMADIAKENHIYLVTSPYLFAKEGELDINEAMIFSPEGKLLVTHIKYGGAMMDNIVEGDKKLQVVETAYGKIGTVICWDADFPSVIRQAGKLEMDMLFSPAADWKEITPLHTRNLYYRGIENGVNIIRETASGQSIISDAKGRIVKEKSTFDTPEAESWIITGQMATKGCKTLYAQIGDLFAYLCIGAEIFLLIWSLISKKESIQGSL